MIQGELTRSCLYRHPVRVYWEDTDAGGVVFYANYLKFFERSRTEWLRTLGFSQEVLRTQGEGLFMVVETSVRYLSPAKLDDILEITVAPTAHGRTSLTLHQEAWRTSCPSLAGIGQASPQLIAQGSIRIVYVGRESLKPQRIPATVLESFTQSLP